MKQALKARIRHETFKFAAYTIILFIFFSAFTFYRLLILSEYGINVAYYGFNIIQSIFLAKAIVLAEALHLGEHHRNRGLFMITIYKTILFLLFVIVFEILEHFAAFAIDGKGFTAAYQTLIDYRLPQIFAGVFVMSFFFILFFALVELNKALGGTKLYDLFFRTK